MTAICRTILERAGSRRSSFLRIALILSATTAATATTAQTTPPGSSSSITLQRVLGEALHNYPLVHAADARIRAALGARSTAGRYDNPMFGYLVENAEFPGADRPLMERETMLMATLPLQPLYQRWPRVRRADAELSAMRAEAAGQRKQIAVMAARAFYRTAFAQISRDAARDLVTWLDSIVAYNRVRAHEGVTAEVDLIRSELERDHAAAEEALQSAELARARAELRTFVDAAADVAFDTLPLRLSPGAPNDSAAIGRRPDVLAAQRRLRAAQAGIGVERTLVLPDIDATVGVKQSAGTTSLIAGATVPFPLFNQNRGEITRASAERDAASSELAAVERTARAELTGAREAARVLTERARWPTAFWRAPRKRGASRWAHIVRAPCRSCR
ncbi:MAG: TolC family protein [Longimicrobiales bacterium]